MLYDSLHEKLLPLAGETLVYPAHGADSLCSKNLSSKAVSTIGAQRLYNYALQPMSRERFIELVIADQPDTPAYFTYDAVLNAREPPPSMKRSSGSCGRYCFSGWWSSSTRGRSCSTRTSPQTSRARTCAVR